jgi:hypothetical protein
MRLSLKKWPSFRLAVAFTACASNVGIPIPVFANDGWLSDQKTGCKIKNLKLGDGADAVIWNGPCDNGYAATNSNGYTVSWYKNGRQTAQYVGQIKDGVLNGTGGADLYERNGLHEMYYGFWVDGELTPFWNDGEKPRVGNYGRTTYYAGGAGLNLIKEQCLQKLEGGLISGTGSITTYNEAGHTISDYSGDLTRCVMDGKGTLRLFNGKGNSLGYPERYIVVIYNGDMENGFPNGIGTAEWPDGSRYVGHWTNGHPDGPNKAVDKASLGTFLAFLAAGAAAAVAIYYGTSSHDSSASTSSDGNHCHALANEGQQYCFQYSEYAPGDVTKNRTMTAYQTKWNSQAHTYSMRIGCNLNGNSPGISDGKFQYETDKIINVYTGDMDLVPGKDPAMRKQQTWYPCTVQ